MPRPHDDRQAYRCAVAPENAAAQLKVGGKLHLVAVLDTSRSGFTVRMQQELADKLKDGEHYVLFHSGERWAIRKESNYGDGAFSNVGFSRIQDLTEVEEPKSNWFQALVQRYYSDTDPAFLMYLMIAFLFACVALPGIGDSLGTAPRIRRGVHVIWEMVTGMIF